MERITSRNNQIVKDTKKLLTSSRARSEQGRFVLEGARLCFDVLHSVYHPLLLLMTEKVYNRYPSEAEALAQRSDAAYLITEEVAGKLGATESTQGIFAVCEKQKPEAAYGKRLLLLDRVQDPGNMGTIIRTAEALGLDGILTYGCCDVYNPKVLRAAMGSVLRMLPQETENAEELLKTLKQTHTVYATVPDETAMSIEQADFSVPCVCIIGNEANGVSESLQTLADARITIRMDGNAESLNAGVAAAITMWEMVRQ